MDYTLDNIKTLDRGINKKFDAVMKSRKGQEYLEFSTVVTSQNRIQSYAWLGDVPAMVEWIDERQKAQLDDYKYDIEKKDWETSIYVTRDDFIFDNLGVVSTKVESMMDCVDEHYEEITASMIVENGNCFDGQPFFGQHTISVKGDDVVYDNYSDFILSRDNVSTVIKTMRQIKKTNGRPARVRPTHIFVAPDLEDTADDIFETLQIDGTTNTKRKKLKVVVLDDLEDGTWCVMDCSRSIKPIILQITKKAKKVDRLTQNPLEGKIISYGVDTMDNAGYSFWQLAHFCDGTEVV